MRKRTITCMKCGCDISNYVSALVLSFITPKYCYRCVEELKNKDKIEEEASKISYLKNNSRIPKNILECDHHGTKLSKAQEELYSKAKGVPSRGYYIWGAIGTGKSFIASKLLISYIENFHECFFISANELSPFNTANNKGSFLRDKLHSSSIVLIDDLGNHAVNQPMVSTLIEAINLRLNSSYITIITSNSNPIDLARKFKSLGGERVDPVMCDALADRLIELCLPIKFDGKSFRVRSFLKELENIKGEKNE